MVRHAPGAQARVALQYLPERLEIEVVNDGARQPGQPMPGLGLGLPGVRERAAAAGGAVTAAGPEPGGAFAVRAWVPAATAPVP